MLAHKTLPLLALAALSLAGSASATTREALEGPSRITMAPLAAPTASPEWTGVTYPDNGKKRQYLIRQSDAKPISNDPGFDTEYILYSAQVDGNAVTVTPTNARLHVNKDSGQAKILHGKSQPTMLGNLGGVTVPAGTMLGVTGTPTITVAGAPAQAGNADRFSAYETLLRSTFLPEAERAACDRSPKDCRDRALAQNLSAYLTRAKEKPEDALDPTEAAYLKARLGDDDANLEEKIKKGELKPADVRAKIVEEVATYAKQGDKTAYDPGNVKGVRSLVEAPKKAPKSDPEAERERATPLGEEIYKQFRRTYNDPADLAAHERELDMMLAFYKDRPEGEQIKALLKGQNDSNKAEVAGKFDAYRKQAMAAAREQLLTPASPSPFKNNKEEDLLDAYCDALATQPGPAPASSAAACKTVGATTDTKAKLEAMAANPGAAGTGYENASCPADAPANDKQKQIDQKCGKWLAEHEKTRQSRQKEQPLPRDDLGVRNNKGGVPNPLGDCKENCGETKKEGPNDKLPWEIGAAWAAVAIIALGILMPGAGLAIAAGAMAAGAVGWYMGKEANR